LQVRLHLIFGQIRQAKASESGIEHQGDAVENKLTVHAHAQIAFSLLERPGVNSTMRWQTQVDAAVVGQILRYLWRRQSPEI
jgi:hypothetical protein